MTIVKYVILVLMLQFCFGDLAKAQDCSNIKMLEQKKLFTVTPLPVLAERDVMWHRRLWREIDLNEKINQLLYFPNEKEKRNCSLYDLLFYNLMKGYIKAYDSKDDHFSIELSKNKLINTVGDSLYDENKQLYYKNLDSRDVVKYWLKEDWFFNAKNSKIEVRIIGICPVKIAYDNHGNIKGYKQLFWLYFNHIRATLVNAEAFKKVDPDDPRVSFDDIFVTRMFDSYIIKKNDGTKQHVTRNKTELDIKLENEKTKLYTFDVKNGVWGY